MTTYLSNITGLRPKTNNSFLKLILCIAAFVVLFFTSHKVRSKTINTTYAYFGLNPESSDRFWVRGFFTVCAFGILVSLIARF